MFLKKIVKTKFNQFTQKIIIKKISYQSIQKYLCIKELWYTYKKGNNSLIGDIHKILIYKNVR